MAQPPRTDGGSVARFWPLYLSAPIVLSGVQALLPALPGIQEALELSDSQIALVTSVYLLPSVLMALPIGLLADRVGRRGPFVVALAVFGFGGLVVTAFPESFGLLLAVRTIQGVAFAAVLSLSITIIGDSLTGPTQVAAQGYRTVAIKVGDGLFPLLGGLLATVAWFAPYSIQILALPLAVLAWMRLRTFPDFKGGSGTKRTRKVLQQLRDLPSLTLQASGFLRFFLKFAFLTYLPLLAAQRGVGVGVVGVVLAVAAIAAIAAGPVAGPLARRFRASALVGVSLFVIAASYWAIASWESVAVLFATAVLFGLADGLYGVIQNATITQAVPQDLRAAFVGVAGTIRNAGKFAAPTLIAIVVLSVSIEAAFAIIGVLAFVGIATAFPLRAFDEVVGHPTGG